MAIRKMGRYESFAVDSSLVTKVFAWMFYGLFLTFGSALGLFLTAANGLISVDTYSTVLTVSLIGYFIFAFISIFIISFTKNKVVALVAYSLYALLLGILLSSIFVVFEVGSIVYALGVTAAVFGIMALYGYFTKRDLSGFGSVLFMILIGVLILSLVNGLLSLFGAGLDILDWILSYVMLGVIIGYVAFDVQNIKKAASFGGLPSSLPILLAFNLYTDFIYIFIRLLALIGRERD